jgi:hypothetical protein
MNLVHGTCISISRRTTHMLVVQLVSIPLGCSAESMLRFTSKAQIESPGYVLPHQLPQSSQVSCCNMHLPACISLNQPAARKVKPAAPQ